MPYIIGTAGHIDHGKTSLIKALTGLDTDRLKEEKERGISIDLGFGHLDLPDGTRAGIVDVPGHERFIRNMLAGAHGMDLVLFTVAADDGVMPQTEEHLDILHLLGVSMVIFLITKVDLVPADRVKEVEEEIRILTLGTSLESCLILPLSAVTGEGVEDLRVEIFRTLQSSKKITPKGYFRLPVDRVFLLQGHGLIVTGTALSGEVRVGNRVRGLPGDQEFRIRSLQVHGQSVEKAAWGQRVALNLSGAEKAMLERGHVICHEKLNLVSDRFDALLEVRPAAAKGIKNHQRVRVHLGTAERLGKVVILGGERLGPKESAYAQVLLAAPVLVLRGDRFIVRDETARRTLGGGIVVHPWARRHGRAESDLRDRLDCFHRGEIPQLIQTFLDENSDFATSIETLYQFLNIQEEEMGGWIKETPGLLSFSADGERIYATERRLQGLREKVISSLKQFHSAHPLAPGMDMEELKAKLPFRVTPRLFRDLVELLVKERAVDREGNFLSLPSHRVEFSSEEKELAEKIKRQLAKNPFAPPDLKQVEREMGVGKAKLMEVVRVMEREGKIVKISTDLYYLREHVDKIKDSLLSYLAEHPEISAATFRDLLGSSRKYTIALLEYFDREGVTVRIGDIRKLKTVGLGGKTPPP